MGGDVGEVGAESLAVVPVEPISASPARRWRYMGDPLDVTYECSAAEALTPARCVTVPGHRRQEGDATNQLSHRQDTWHERAVPSATNGQFCCPPLG